MCSLHNQNNQYCLSITQKWFCLFVYTYNMIYCYDSKKLCLILYVQSHLNTYISIWYFVILSIINFSIHYQESKNFWFLLSTDLIEILLHFIYKLHQNLNAFNLTHLSFLNYHTLVHRENILKYSNIDRIKSKITNCKIILSVKKIMIFHFQTWIILKNTFITIKKMSSQFFCRLVLL